MEENKHPHIGFEPTDVDAWAVGKFGIALVLICIASLALLFGMFRYYQEALNARPGAAVMDPVKVFPQPQLQRTPVLDLQAVRAAEEQALSTYGWVDQPKGVVRIPIDRAIDLLAQRGLPSRPPESSVLSSGCAAGASGCSLAESSLGNCMSPNCFFTRSSSFFCSSGFSWRRYMRWLNRSIVTREP